MLLTAFFRRSRPQGPQGFLGTHPEGFPRRPRALLRIQPLGHPESSGAFSGFTPRGPQSRQGLSPGRTPRNTQSHQGPSKGAHTKGTQGTLSRPYIFYYTPTQVRTLLRMKGQRKNINDFSHQPKQDETEFKETLKRPYLFATQPSRAKPAFVEWVGEFF